MLHGGQIVFLSWFFLFLFAKSKISSQVPAGSVPGKQTNGAGQTSAVIEGFKKCVLL
jgi:hypothetical protein